jgi:hypothetical protein
MSWPPNTKSLAPEEFDRIATARPDFCGVPAWHRGDDESVVWPKPDPAMMMRDMPENFAPRIQRQEGRSVCSYRVVKRSILLGYEDDGSIPEAEQAKLDHAMRMSVWQLVEMDRLGIPWPD